MTLSTIMSRGQFEHQLKKQALNGAKQEERKDLIERFIAAQFGSTAFALLKLLDQEMQHLNSNIGRHV